MECRTDQTRLLYFLTIYLIALYLKKYVTAMINLADLSKTITVCIKLNTAKTINKHIVIRILFSAVLSCSFFIFLVDVDRKVHF